MHRVLFAQTGKMFPDSVVGKQCRVRRVETVEGNLIDVIVRVNGEGIRHFLIRYGQIATGGTGHQTGALFTITLKILYAHD